MSRKTTRIVITSKEIDDKLNPKNKSMAERFLQNKSRTVSDSTIRNYRSDLRILFTILYKNFDNKLFVDLSKIDYMDIFDYVSSYLKWGSARQNRFKSAISSFSNFILRFYDERYPDFKNLVILIIESAPPEKRREKTILSEAEVDSLLQHFKNSDSQIACWISLAASSGMRFAEIKRVTVSIIDNSKNAFDKMFLLTEKIKVKGRGGNRKDNKYILRSEFLPYYKDWKKKRAKILDELGVPEDERTDSLFIDEFGNPAKDSVIRSWIKDMSNIVNKNVYPHAFRHYLTTKLARRGIPDRLITALLGWKSTDMINIYNDLTLDEEFGSDDLSGLKI